MDLASGPWRLSNCLQRLRQSQMKVSLLQRTETCSSQLTESTARTISVTRIHGSAQAVRSSNISLRGLVFCMLSCSLNLCSPLLTPTFHFTIRSACSRTSWSLLYSCILNYVIHCQPAQPVHFQSQAPLAGFIYLTSSFRTRPPQSLVIIGGSPRGQVPTPGHLRRGHGACALEHGYFRLLFRSPL